MSNPAPGFGKYPNHKLSFSSCRARARAGETTLAESTNAVLLHEGNYPPVVYFPPNSLAREHLTKTEHSTYCPFKGHASYWSLGEIGSDVLENAAWGYKNPYDECECIRGFVAFYPDRVDVEILPSSEESK